MLSFCILSPRSLSAISLRSLRQPKLITLPLSQLAAAGVFLPHNWSIVCGSRRPTLGSQSGHFRSPAANQIRTRYRIMGKGTERG